MGEGPPRDERGRFVPTTCPLPDCTPGHLKYEGGGHWRCDGLLDPNDPNKELEACWFFHIDGEPRNG